jgi:hypothetical protein
VSGSNAEFFGSTTDDVGTVRAEFYVDGVLKYTDVNVDEHYHYGGTHNLWDTTTLANGAHVLIMKGFDTKGQSASQTVNVTVANAVASNGLSGQYFDNNDFTAFRHVRTDATVNFNWGNGAPDPAIGVDSFSVRWIGRVQAATSETYTFSVLSDDGARLWVNGQLIVDKWVAQGPTEWGGSIALTAGEKYDLRLDYFDGGGGASCQLLWSTPTRAKAVIPQVQLFPPSATAPNVVIESVSTGKAYLVRTAKVDALMYIDRTSRIDSMPTSLVGGVLIRTSNDDKYVNVASHLTFSVARASTVTVAHDIRTPSLPTWLDDGTWTATGRVLRSVTRTYSLFSKSVPVGNVTLGGNQQGVSGAESITNYVVIVRPIVVPTASG